jgi:hypothetical protein
VVLDGTFVLSMWMACLHCPWVLLQVIDCIAAGDGTAGICISICGVTINEERWKSVSVKRLSMGKDHGEGRNLHACEMSTVHVR